MREGGEKGKWREEQGKKERADRGEGKQNYLSVQVLPYLEGLSQTTVRTFEKSEKFLSNVCNCFGFKVTLRELKLKKSGRGRREEEGGRREGGRRKERRRKEEGGRRKEEGGRRKEDGGRRK
jgi:hypothetical protein